ncbi:MAG: hypothetical protein HYV41_02605 [Candidatus Magasanikbacteria bacterium]|nr:hypothetical protein [Candidatus Magasanikbacteria bacterium]
MQIIKFVLGGIGMIAMIPSFLLFPALIITAIIGANKKDYTYLKKYLKIWGYSLLAVVGVLILYMLSSFVTTLINGGAQ